MRRKERSYNTASASALLFTIIFLSAAVCATRASADCDWEGGEIFSGCGENCVALTFDDGPHPEHTDKILGILGKYDIKATFFTVGENVEYFPDVFCRVINAGHEIGNHTYEHAYLKGRRDAEVYYQIRHADDVFFSLTEYMPHFLRPPGGLYDSKLMKIAAREDKVIAMWTIDTQDWQHKSAEEIYNTVVNQVRGGDIILMHDYISGESHTAQALEKIIPALESRGYMFVTLSDMYFNYRSK